MHVVLEAKHLNKRYSAPRHWFAARQYVQALNNVSLQLGQGETLAIVGESGCGKSTLARALAMLEHPDNGDLNIAGVDVLRASKKQRQQLRREVQMVFQNPYASLNPRRLIADQLAEPLLLNTTLSASQCQQHVTEMLEQVGLRAEHARRYPHMFSGGQRQRIAIARAMMLKPKILIADEPTSALDVSIQAQVLNLFVQLQQQYATSYVFISHDLNVVRHIADRIAVMYFGHIVESGRCDDIFLRPQHPYTQALLKATPEIGKPLSSTPLLRGELPNPLQPPKGCAFHPRCSRASAICQQETPVQLIHGSHSTCCHHINPA